MGVAHVEKIKLESVRVRVTHKQNIMGIGPNDPRQRTLKITELRRHIEVQGDLSEKDVETLLWGANNCPISNTIEGAVPITTRLEVVK